MLVDGVNAEDKFPNSNLIFHMQILQNMWNTWPRKHLMLGEIIALSKKKKKIFLFLIYNNIQYIYMFMYLFKLNCNNFIAIKNNLIPC